MKVSAFISKCWGKQKYYVHSKRRELLTPLHGVTSEKTGILNIKEVENSKSCMILNFRTGIA